LEVCAIRNYLWIAPWDILVLRAVCNIGCNSDIRRQGLVRQDAQLWLQTLSGTKQKLALKRYLKGLYLNLMRKWH